MSQSAVPLLTRLETSHRAELVHFRGVLCDLSLHSCNTVRFLMGSLKEGATVEATEPEKSSLIPHILHPSPPNTLPTMQLKVAD